MLKLEYILLMSRDFHKKPKILTLRRVMRFINEEITNANKENQVEVHNFIFYSHISFLTLSMKEEINQKRFFF